MTEFVDLDVRPILRTGKDPFTVIMAALDELAPGQGLRLYAPFKPVPLFGVMASRGFSHQETELEGGQWEVLFSPAAKEPESPVVAGDTGSDEWPDPVVQLDNRDLDPPEPMVRILAAAEQLTPGQTLSALLAREPIFLFPELAKRGYQWRGGFASEGDTYQLTVRVDVR